MPSPIFFIDKDHPKGDLEISVGSSGIKLAEFKERLRKQHVVNFFASPLDLRGKVINSLSRYREKDSSIVASYADLASSPDE